MATEYITDPDDFCRYCRGKGSIRSEEYRAEGRVTVTEWCHQCGGTGCRSVRLTDIPQVAE